MTTRIGVTIHISLDPGFNWNDPKSDSDIVQVEGIQRPASGGLDADLRAVAVGQATVTTAGGLVCPGQAACPQLARVWGLRVKVIQTLPSPQTVTVTEADSGRTYSLHKGDGFDVELSGPWSNSWSEPASSQQAVLERVAVSSGSTAVAHFLAIGSGTTTVTATDNPNCYPQCLVPSRLFDVRVSVTR